MTEHEIQSQLVRWFRAEYPDDYWSFFSVPNAGMRSGIAGKRMREEGLVKGVSDLILLMPRGKYHGLCLELKTEIGVVSRQQADFLHASQQQGYCAMVAKGLKDAIGKLRWYVEGAE